MIVTWVVSYDDVTLEPMLVATMAGDGPRLLCELAGADVEHAQVLALLSHLQRLAATAPAALELPHELVEHVRELFAWDGMPEVLELAAELEHDVDGPVREIVIPLGDGLSSPPFPVPPLDVDELE